MLLVVIFIFIVVSDKSPFNLSLLEVNATSFYLSWKFTFEEKLSPFQGFAVFYESSKPAAEKKMYESKLCEGEVVGLQPFTEYKVRVAPRHLLGNGFISDVISIKTHEWGMNVYDRTVLCRV